MKTTTITFFIFLFSFFILSCDDGNSTTDNPADRAATLTLFGGIGSVTVQGYLTKAELDHAANAIAGKINAYYDANAEEHDILKEIFDRGVTYIVEPNPEGYSNIKTTGDGKTVYIALDKVDTGYVVDGVALIYRNGTYISKAAPTNTQGALI